MNPMRHDVLLFDLDGTLSDPLPGIAACINYALSYFGHPVWDEGVLARFVGPPLDQTFKEMIGECTQQEISALVLKYRERYQQIGYAENRLYEGVAESLQSLGEAGAVMAICTSKPAYLAEKILQHFSIFHHFRFVSGGDIGVEKWQQIAELTQQECISSRSVMIGDRAVDLQAAHQYGLQSGAVLWGYGGIEELQRESPAYYFHRAQDWQQLSQC